MVIRMKEYERERWNMEKKVYFRKRHGLQICNAAWKEFAAYCKRNQVQIGLMALIVLLVNGRRLVSPVIGIDTEIIINDSKLLYESWLGIGRQGLVFLKMVLGTLEYNAYYSSVLTHLFLLGTYVGFGFLFEYVLGYKEKMVESGILRWSGFAFGAVVMAHPIFAEQFYFSLQSAEIAAGFVLTAAGLLCSHFWGEWNKGTIWKRRLCFLCAVLLMQITFSVYQSFVPLYLLGCIMLGLLRAIKGKQFTIGEEIKYELRLAAVFICGFLINQVTTLLFFHQSDYVSNQILWKEEGLRMGLMKIAAHMLYVVTGYVVTGTDIFYSGMFFLIALGVLLCMLWYFRQILGKKRKIWMLLLLAGVYTSPFYLTVLMGGRSAIRAQLVLPFTMGMMLYLMGVLLVYGKALERERVQSIQEKDKAFFKGKTLKGGKMGTLLLAYLIIVSAITFREEMVKTNKLYYTDDVRYQEDCRLAHSLKDDIAEFTDMANYSGVVLFVGKKDAVLNAACLEGESIGISFFAWDTDVEPVNYCSSSRILGFLRCLGINYMGPSIEQAEKGTKASQKMSCYPEKGSIAWCDDMLVVKLSE